MAKRIVSTVILWVISLGALWIFRTPGAVALIALFAVLALREFYRLQAAAGRAPFAWLGMFFGGLITAAPWAEERFGWPAHPLLAMAVVIFAIRILGERPADKRVEALASTLFGLVYVALMLQYLVRIITPLGDGDPFSAGGRLLLCLWLVAVAKFCDTGALLTGLLFGRHPMAPQISPKKTWEGAVGGIATSMLVGALGAWLGGSHGRGNWPADLTPLRAALIALPIAAVAIVSDLVESVIKRQADIKDSGHAVPGIGGVFDVVDSLLLAAPVGYFLLGMR
jgi:phosphatidate cytidylyltransferase